MTRERIGELRQRLGPPASIEEMTELLDAAKAWALAEAEARRRYRFGSDPVRWLWDRGRVSYTFSRNAGYETLQGAVIAALKGVV